MWYKIVRLFFIFYNFSENEIIEVFVTLFEIKVTLLGFRNQTVLTWMSGQSNFLKYFFDLIGLDLKEVIEQSWLNWKIARAMNYAFTALVPKCSKTSSFHDYKPISLCNMVYKLGAKILANKLKQDLFEGISKE